MKKVYILIVAMVLSLGAGAALAGTEVFVYDLASNSGVTLVGSPGSGVSLIQVFDLKGKEHDGNWSLGLSKKVYYAHNTSVKPYGTGNAATSGNSITYLYAVSNRSLSPREWEALGTSGATAIVTIPLNSGNTVGTVWEFTPEEARFMAILAQSGITDIHKPGFHIVRR